MKKTIFLFLVFFTGTLCFGQENNSSKEINKLKNAVQKLRKKVEKLEEKAKEDEDGDEADDDKSDEDDDGDDNDETFEEWLPFLKQFKKYIKLPGYAIFEYGDRQTEGSSLRGLDSRHRAESFFRAHEIELLPTLKLAPWAKIYAELEFESHNTFGLENIWAEFTFFQSFRIRIGKFFTNYGLYNRIHRRALLPTFDALLFQRNAIFESATTGVEVEYKYNLQKVSFEFSAWMGNGKSGASDASDSNNNKSVGARIGMVSRDKLGPVENFKVGATFYTGKVKNNLSNAFTADPTQFPDMVFAREGDTTTAGAFASAGYSAYGEPLGGYTDRAFAFHFKMEIANFLIWAEYIINFVDPVGATKSFRQKGWFAFLGYEIDPQTIFGKTKVTEIIGRFLPFIMYEEYEANDRLTGELGSNRRFYLGVNWKIRPFLIWKFEFQNNRFVRASQRNFNSYLTQLVLTF